MLKYQTEDEGKQKLPYNKTQALPQKHGVWFMQENSHTILQIYIFGNMCILASYFPHIMYFLSLLYKIKENTFYFYYFKYI